jgi:O-antigen/teichoic acid export membrane protein
VKPGEIARSVSRGAFYLAIEKGAGALSGFAYVALLMRWLGPTKYGIITLATSFAGLAATFTGNFEVFLERFAAEYQASGDLHALRRALSLSLALKLALGLAASIVLWAMTPFLARQFGVPELLVLLPVLTLTVAFDGFATAGRSTLFGLQNFRWMSAISVLFHIAKTVMVGLLWYTKHGLPALAVGLTTLAVTQGVGTTLVALWVLHRRMPGAAPDERTPVLKPMLAYCVPMLGARVTFMSGQNLSKVVLGKLFDVAQLGYFTFAFQTIERMVELFHTLPSVLLPSLTHMVARRERDRLRHVFGQAQRLIQVAAILLSFGLFTFAREITLLLGSPLFLLSVPALRVLALVPAVRTAQQPLMMLFQALRHPGTVLRLALVKFVGEFGSYFLLVPSLGVLGAAWSNVVGAAAAYAAASVLMARALPEGAAERTRAALTGLAILAALIGLVLLTGLLPLVPGLVLRITLVPVAVIAVCLSGLVVRYDLEKLQGLPIASPALSRARDRALRVAGRHLRSHA